MLPDPPRISDVEMKRCRDTGDYVPVIFEWYKFVGGLCVSFSNLMQSSSIVRTDISVRDYGVLTGLLCRCARLILSNIALSHEGKFGETTSIVDRCIFESSITLSWLCVTEIEDRFQRYVGDSLKTELELAAQVRKNVTERGGAKTNIEARMLNSIADCLSEAGFSEAEVESTKKLPDLASMLEALGHQRISYTVGQRISSHHVHGTWVGLRQHYMFLDEGCYKMKQSSDMHVNQYVYIAEVVLEALKDFVLYIFIDDDKDAVISLFEDTASEIRNLNQEIIATDFDIAEQSP